MKAANIQVFRLLERAFLLAALLVSTGLDLSLQASGADANLGEGNMFQRAINLVIYAVVFSLLALRPKQVASVVSRDSLLWMLLLLACVSVVWSALPAMTLRRSGALVGTMGVGVYLATRFTIGEQIRLLAEVLVLAAVINLAVIVFWPARGVYGTEVNAHGTYFRGLYVNKNVLGRLMALGALAAVFAFCDGGKRWLWGLGFVLCLGMLALTHSGTAIVVLGVTLATLPVLALLRWNYSVALSLIVSALAPGALAMAWFWANADTVFGVLGKDTTFTGRSDIWAAVTDMIWKRPWLGYGLNGFWRGWEGPSAYVCQIAGWEVPHAHDGFLDLLLALGVWGLALFVIGFTVAFFRALAAMVHAARISEGLWPVVYLLFTLIYNVTESTILRPNSIFWMLFVAAILSRPAMKLVGRKEVAEAVVAHRQEMAWLPQTHGEGGA